MATRNRKEMDTEYHHFIPQFILRKYTDYARPEPEAGFNKREAEKQVSKVKSKARASVLDLKSNPGRIERSRTTTIFGEQDMYRDADATATDKFEIEKKLSALEQRVSRIIERIENEHACGQSSTQICRTDKDELRRFLFIMLYRNRKLHRRFNTAAEEYKSIDWRELRKYMQEKGFTSTKVVWLENIRTFLDVRLGPDVDRWTKEVMKNAFPQDARWFVKHLNGTFLSFCTPGDRTDEFILTENAYGVFEGPSNSFEWTDWHVFAPINPRLLIVMPHDVLHPFEGIPADISTEMSESFARAVEKICNEYEDPTMARSCLADLPVKRPQPSYPRFRRVSATHPSQHRLRETDTFTFEFFKLESHHVQLINSIFLEQAIDTRAIVFKSENGLRRALEAYLGCSTPGFKVVTKQEELKSIVLCPTPDGVNISQGLHDDGREAYLRLLETAAGKVGSTVEAKYEMRNARLVELLPPFPRRFHDLYCALGKPHCPKASGSD
jgi:Protein of unknown function (DUF4238)